MRSLLIILLYGLISLSVPAQTPAFQWATTFGSTSNDYAISIDFDGAGNSVSAGTFGETIDFDPGPAQFNLSSNGHFDVVILKLSPAGNFIWAKSLGSSFADMPSCIKLDDNNNVYVSGSFGGTVDFDPGAGVFNMAASNGAAFILKLDANGNFLWAIQFCPDQFLCY
ncbi:MAG: hypothetical protein EOP51_11680 [Sphingobacteriales bacterium]|nr:MAG: hypothetical protein EOP51_11680 [Sphingobacteriales bacterium]